MAEAAVVTRIAAALRLRMLPLPLLPIAIAWSAAASERSIDAVEAALVCVVVVSLHLLGIAVTDLYDHRAGTDKLARLDRSAIATGGLQLETGALQPRHMLVTSGVLAALAVAGTSILGDARLWILLAIGLLLVTQHAGPPLRIAYVGAGLGELALLAAYGPLPAAAASIAFSGGIDGSALLAASLVGALTATGLGSHHLLHWRADRAATKRTPAVILGEQGFLAAIGIVDILVYATLILAVILGWLPVLAVAGALGAPVVGAAWLGALRDPLPQRTMQLLGAHLGAAVIAASAAVLGFALS